MTLEAASPLEYTITGDNRRPAVLFLHGFMGSKSDWAGLTDALEREFLCVALDLPGHGASTGLSGASYTIEGTAKAVLGTLDALGIEHAVTVGYSMGGRLALYLALRYPARLSGCFLESASPGIEDAEGRRSRREADEARAVRLETGDFEEFLRDWYRQPLFAPLARDEELLRRTMEARMRNDPAELARSLRGMGTGSQPSLWGELPNLQVPTLAVAGDLDDKFVEIAARMANTSPLVRATTIPGAGHDAHDEAPADYLALLRGFLDSPPTRASG